MSAPTWSGLLTRLLAGDDLDRADTEWVMDRVMSGESSDVQLAAFTVALRAKGETPDEVAGLVAAMLAHAVRVDVPGRAVDIVGTGGDRANTVNISTMAAVVMAGAGATVVKHGNRAATSKCGAADLLEGLGVAISLTAPQVARTAAEAGIGFCFAPVYHPSFRYAGAVRRELAVPTVFNFLGPLTNPAQPAAGAIGCGNPTMAPVMAQVFADRGADVLVFRGDDGLDELTTTTTSTVWRVRAGAVERLTLDPAELGIAPADPAALRGGDVAQNVQVARDLFAGQRSPVRDAVVLNAGAGLAAYAGLSGDLTADLAAGVQRAQDALDSGAAARVLDRWIELGRELAATA
ncbi:anthranilate phosphoribosyltransferase [Nakamurella sp.]|uniref:anthranilate phosphoribosyltransferase n=1 Tax=Nakamurella sp. TaxID=1869182 RepID=UPI003B3A9B3B